MEGKRIPAKFYKTGVGNEPVREWLRQLSQAERKVIGIDIKTVPKHDLDLALKRKKNLEAGT
ncbi:MAG: hypothetical protein AAGA75_23665 [Cyanobacteria bacterium P01_E01_bin.6]